MSEERKIAQVKEQRGLVSDTVAAVVSGVSGGVAGAVATQAVAKISADKGKADKKE